MSLDESQQSSPRKTIAHSQCPHVVLNPVSPPASATNLLKNSAVNTPAASVPLSSPTQVANDRDPESAEHRHYYTAHGRFAGNVAAAIDAKAGLPPEASNLVPFVDAPLFGEIDLRPQYTDDNFIAELPPSAHANTLAALYWEYIDPIEPVLDQKQFFHALDDAYAGTNSTKHGNGGIWLSIINVVFALAVQRQEATPEQHRNEEAGRYFQRGWAILRPETVIWEPGSLELVQCLMLMNRYLHCTNNQHMTWMTAGLAMRIAQNMCNNLPVSSATLEDKQIRQKVWASCVGLDRCVSWSLGRTSAPTLISLPRRSEFILRDDELDLPRGEEHHTLMLELFEIGNHIQLAQTQTRNTLAAKLRLPRLYQQDEYHVVAVQLDACLQEWESNLPVHLKRQGQKSITDRRARAKAYLLHLHLLHARIYLFRPLLARLYVMNSQESTSNPFDRSSLSDKLLHDCAKMCIEAAQNVTTIVMETMQSEGDIGLLPWWHRVYYLHIAGTNFLAAMCTLDLFTSSVEVAWQNVLSGLHKHEHLSKYVPQCIQMFEMLSMRIRTAQKGNENSDGDGLLSHGPPMSFDDIFQDVDFDFDSFVFGVDGPTSQAY